jgi:hypothetical protein
MRARTKSLYGEILSEYMRTADGIDFHFVVPANTKATLVLPAFRGQLKEAGREVTPKTAGVERVEYGDSTATLVVGSGEYRFRLSQ